MRLSFTQRPSNRDTGAPLGWQRVFSRSVIHVVLANLILGGLTLPTLGSEPSVYFDVLQHAACRPVDAPLSSETPQLFSVPIADPDEQLIDVAFDISTLIRFDAARDIGQLLFVIESPSRTLEVVDYAPRTELTSRYVGHIEQTQQQDRNTSSGLSANFAPTDYLNASANANQGSKTMDAVKFQTVPPMELLSASGTVSRGSAVYFKFRSTPQTTLEGSRQVRVLFRVPRDWRGDYVYVRCAAYGPATADGGNPRCGAADFMVPLYLEGDIEARDLAERLVDAEHDLRKSARQIQPRTSYKESFSDKLSALFDIHTTKTLVPENWLHTVLTSHPTRDDFGFEQHLPTSVQKDLNRFTATRAELFRLHADTHRSP